MKSCHVLQACLGAKAMTRTSSWRWEVRQGWRQHRKPGSKGAGAGRLTHSDLVGGVALGGARCDQGVVACTVLHGHRSLLREVMPPCVVEPG